MNVTELKDMCRVVRGDIVTMVHDAGSGHPGGSLSATELMVGLFFNVMKIDPEKPEWRERDRFILSKGHVTPVYYSVLAHRGFFPVETLKSFRKLGSILQGHPHKEGTPGCDCSSGSLGQGLSVTNGIAIGLKKQGIDARVYCLMGDGELQEGQCWEAIMTAAQNKLDNVCAIVDYNHVQLDDATANIKNMGDLAAKFHEFGWNVIELDGHDMGQVLDAFAMAKAYKGKPTVLVAETVKGKGVSFMENDCNWHGNAPSDAQLMQALAEINGEV